MMKDGWLMTDEGWLMTDEGMIDYKLFDGFALRQTDEQTNRHL